MSAATAERRRVALRYRSRRDELTERAVDPYGLVYDAERWYLVGHCHLRGAQRVFRLDRVVDAALRQETLTPPAGFDPRREVERVLAAVPGEWPVTVLLAASAEEARARLWPLVGALRDSDEGAVFEVRATDLDWLARHLAGCGLRFSVLRPPQLNEALRRYAGEILARAGGAVPV